jgi:hypothetical protein
MTAAEHRAKDLFLLARMAYADGDELTAFDYAHRARDILTTVGVYAEPPETPPGPAGAQGLGPQGRFTEGN